MNIQPIRLKGGIRSSVYKSTKRIKRTLKDQVVMNPSGSNKITRQGTITNFELTTDYGNIDQLLDKPIQEAIGLFEGLPVRKIGTIRNKRNNLVGLWKLTSEIGV